MAAVEVMARIDTLQDDRGLLTCFQGAMVKEEWVKAYSEAHSITTLDDFIYMIDGEAWEASITSFVEAVPSLKGNRIAVARFKSSFEAGRLALRQAATPATKSEDVDEVLPEGTMNQLNAEWTKRYHLAFEASLEPSEQLRSRVHREWRKYNMSVLDVKKIRSVLSMAIPRSQESVQLPGGLVLGFDKEVLVTTRTVTDYYWALRVLAHAWGWAGNYNVSYEGQTILMMELSAALGYADKALRDTMDYGKGSLTWLQRNDVLTRGKMATLIRRGWPAGMALGEAVREAHLEWRSPAIQPAMESPRTPPSKKPLEDPPEVEPKRRQLKGDGHKTVSQIKGGQKICKPYNDGRGCSNTKCPNLHACDVRLESGAACLSRRHNRLNHE